MAAAQLVKQLSMNHESLYYVFQTTMSKSHLNSQHILLHIFLSQMIRDKLNNSSEHTDPK